MDTGISKLGSRQVYKSDANKSLEEQLGAALNEAVRTGESAPGDSRSEPLLGEMTKAAVIERFKQISPDHPLIHLAAEFSLDRPAKPEVYLRKRLATFFSDLFTDGEGYARNVLSNMTLSALQDIKTLLPKAIEKAEARNDSLKQQKIDSILNKVKAMAIQEGLSLEDVLGIAKGSDEAAPRTKRKYPNMVVRYRCETMGRAWYWTGATKMPMAFKVAMAEQDLTSVEPFKLPESEQATYDADIHDSKMTPKMREQARKILLNLGRIHE